MRRVTRYLFTLCSAVSLLLCVAVCVLWVRNIFVADVVLYTGRVVFTCNAERSVTCWRYSPSPSPQGVHGWEHYTYPVPRITRGIWAELRTLGHRALGPTV